MVNSQVNHLVKLVQCALSVLNKSYFHKDGCGFIKRLYCREAETTDRSYSNYLNRTQEERRGLGGVNFFQILLVYWIFITIKVLGWRTATAITEC